VVGASAKLRGRFVVVRAAEGYAYSVNVLRVSRTLSAISGTASPNIDLQVKLPKLSHGSYRVVVKLNAETNPARVSTFTKRLQA
jgi:hypothetical protein